MDQLKLVSSTHPLAACGVATGVPSKGDGGSSHPKTGSIKAAHTDIQPAHCLRPLVARCSAGVQRAAERLLPVGLHERLLAAERQAGGCQRLRACFEPHPHHGTRVAHEVADASAGAPTFAMHWLAMQGRIGLRVGDESRRRRFVTPAQSLQHDCCPYRAVLGVVRRSRVILYLIIQVRS
jgi:hypothetical protein